MKTYKAIVVEDERLPRLSLIQKLETYHPDITVVDSCEECESALQSIMKHRPDILFLDIQLPGRDSLWLLEQVNEMMPLPCIIFTTAYNDPEYLLKAIKFGAVDYLLKPVNLLELGKALKKARERIKPKPGTYSFRTISGTLYASNDDILYLKADGNYTQIYLLQGEETIFERLGDIDQKLDNEHFLRAGRSLMLNRKYIYKVDRKRNLCLLKTPAGTTHQVKVSEGGMESIRRVTGNLP